MTGLSFDLVMATLGRTAEVARLLESLAAQTHGSARLIVVDQNPDDRLVPVLASFDQALPVLHLRCEAGISHARNVGMAHVTADVVGFPDDDCWYPPDLLQRVSAFFVERPEWDGVNVRSVDAEGLAPSEADPAHSGALTRYNLWRRVGTYRLFFRRRAVENVGPFDVELGLGTSSPWGAGEDLEYVQRCLAAGHAVYYDRSLAVHHPRRRERSRHPDLTVGYAYGMGFGRAMKKGGLPWCFASYLCLRAFGGVALELLRGRPDVARFHLAVGRGRLKGWLRSPPVASSARPPRWRSNG